MTVTEAIAELQKIEPKTLPVFFDCPHCGHSHPMDVVVKIALVKTRVEVPE